MNEPRPIKFNGKTYFGFKKIPKWLKDRWRKEVNYTCMDCKKHEDEVGTLETHRIIRGCDGGLYVMVGFNHPLCNQKMCCSKCHKKYNYSKKTGDY